MAWRILHEILASVVWHQLATKRIINVVVIVDFQKIEGFIVVSLAVVRSQLPQERVLLLWRQVELLEGGLVLGLELTQQRILLQVREIELGIDVVNVDVWLQRPEKRVLLQGRWFSALEMIRSLKELVFLKEEAKI